MSHPDWDPKTEAAVYVVDDDEATRRATLFAVRSLGWHARGYASAEALIADVEQLCPGCILTDFRMPGRSGLQLLEELRRLGRRDPVIVMTGFADVALAVETFRSGAVDLLQKPFSLQDLERSLEESARKLMHQAQFEASQSEAAERLARLAPREREVAERIAEGKSSKMIARELGISPRTVDAYRANVHSKTGCASIAEVVALMIIAKEYRPPTS